VAGLVAGVVAAAQLLDQLDRLGDLVVRRSRRVPDGLERRAIDAALACSKA
jgi:hypothetical protein